METPSGTTLSIYILSLFSRAGQVSQNLVFKNRPHVQGFVSMEAHSHEAFSLGKNGENDEIIPPLTEIANFSRNYFILRKVYTDEGVIK